MWNNWKNSHPTPGEYVYGRDLDALDLWEIGWAVGEEGNTKVVVEADPVTGIILFDEWQAVPPPVDNWKNNQPDPGKYVYVRNLDVPEKWEIGRSVESGGSIKVVVIHDAGMKGRKFDEWQPVPLPVDNT